MKDARLKEIRRRLCGELDRIISWWGKHSVDQQYGGFHGRILFDNTVVAGAPKGIILNSRILWSFSAVYRFTPQPELRDLAHRSFEYLVQFFYDREYGGFYWQLDPQGRPIETRKQIYAQAFALYGLAEYVQAFQSEDALNLAQSVYRDIEHYSRDHDRRGYFEGYDSHWNLLADLRLSERDANEKKTMNTHLHILEAYTNLYRTAPDDQLGSALNELIRIFLDQIIDPASSHCGLFFDENWTLRSETISFGHEIEAAWLLCEAVEAIGVSELTGEVRKVAVKIADRTLKEGLAPDGSLFYEQTGAVLNTDRHWWPQAEAMVGFMNAFEITGEKHYLEVAFGLWDFIEQKIVNREYGEWYWSVRADGKPNTRDDKLGFWKAPYHNSRGCLEMIRRLDRVDAL